MCFYALQNGNREIKSVIGLSESYGLEEKWGLFILLKLRGKRDPPTSTLIVAMDSFSANQFVEKGELSQWDRSYHAQLIEKLSFLGADAIAFDVYFNQNRNLSSDIQLEHAIKENQSVILYRHLQRQANHIDYAFEPLENLARAASGLGVFPLPKIPERVNYFWSFFPVQGIFENSSLTNSSKQTETALDWEVPSLPISTLYTLSRKHSSYDEFMRIVSSCDDGSQESNAPLDYQPLNFTRATQLKLLRRHFRQYPKFSLCTVASWNDISSSSKTTNVDPIDALLSALVSNPKKYLNFFGTAGSVPTISYSTVLNTDVNRLGFLSGKTVFVGHSDTQAADQIDGRATVFTDKNGLYISGVEIAATAFDNLLNNEKITPANERIMYYVIAIVGFLAAVVSILSTARKSLIIYILFGVSYLVAAVYLLRHHALWIPIINPLFIQIPIIFLVSTVIKAVYERYVRSQYEIGIQALMPQKALSNWKSDLRLTTEAERVYCCCIITDIAGYTSVAEELTPEALATLSNDYFGMMGKCVQRHNGEVLFVDGDSMTIVWINDSPNDEARLQSIDCACALKTELDKFNASRPDTPFPTRIGMSCGWLAAGNIQAGAQYMYRVHGDTIITASRLESLNKQLGTTVLATRSITEGISEYLYNPIGTFVLKGKEEAILIDEVIGHRSTTNDDMLYLVRDFQKALTLLKLKNVTEAEKMYRQIDTRAGGHALSRFYLDLIGNRNVTGNTIDEKTVIRMMTK